MRKVALTVIALNLAANLAMAQQPKKASIQSLLMDGTKIYTVGAEATAPVLLPPAIVVSNDEKCPNKLKGKVILTTVVTAQGNTLFYGYQSALGNGLDQLALEVVKADNFTPAIHDGAPVAAFLSADVALEACTATAPDGSGNMHPTLHLRSMPVQKFSTFKLSPEDASFISEFVIGNAAGQVKSNLSGVGGGVSQPVPQNQIAAVYSDEARMKKINGYAIVSLIVDQQGLPRLIRVVRPLGYGLDSNAVESVRKYRFKPATKQDGQPVSVMVSVEVNFRIL